MTGEARLYTTYVLRMFTMRSYILGAHVHFGQHHVRKLNLSIGSVLDSSVDSLCLLGRQLHDPYPLICRDTKCIPRKRRNRKETLRHCYLCLTKCLRLVNSISVCFLFYSWRLYSKWSSRPTSHSFLLILESPSCI